MCGFLGRLRIDGLVSGEVPLAAGLPLLRRRGPDSSREWRSADGLAELLHARLAMVDMDERAHQPLTDSRRRVSLAFVGEVYNHRELRKELADYPFRTESDTEVILAAYLLRGIDGLGMLKGMVACCLVDEERRRIILFRDAVGKKPLFFARWQGYLVFGSSLLAMARAAGASPRIDPAVLDFYWQKMFVPPQQTVFFDAQPVLPGEAIEFDWQGAEVGRRRLEPPAAVKYGGESFAESMGVLRELIDRAVFRRLDHQHRPALLLSGGIDSTVIADAAARVASREGADPRLEALTLASLLPWLDDEPYAKMAAKRLGLDLKLVRPDFSRLGENVVRALDLQDEPLGMPSFFLLERLVHAAANHNRILLSGDGGDEVFLGYGRPEEWQGTGQGETTSLSGPALPSWFSPWARETAGPVLLGHMLPKVDRASVEQGVEIRCPLLDWEVMAYARGLPFEFLTCGGQAKGMLKETLTGWPRRFIRRPKLGFTYHLRWQWVLDDFNGLRENIHDRALDAFAGRLPKGLRGRPDSWGRIAVFRHFNDAWRLLAWSRFLFRLSASASGVEKG
ncbi:MAG: asparagine synthase-related protein [Verrucomicrobiae bacterium]|nr:asparagine synthase-related protein [Verrucomicrobiae bacterium]